MSARIQWVAYRYAERAMLRAPLPSATDAGNGWRSVELRRQLSPDQLDWLVVETARKVGAALAITLYETGFGYVVAATEDGREARLLVRPEAAEGTAEADAALERVGVGSTDSARSRRNMAKTFAQWSVEAPRSVAVDALLELLERDDVSAEAATAELVAMLEISLPEAHPPSYTDLHEVARAQAAPPKKRLGLFRRKA